jgi:hypothetical protein
LQEGEKVSSHLLRRQENFFLTEEEICYSALGKSAWDRDVYLRIGLGALMSALGCTVK